ncbi:MAG: hypothetical protein HOQ02_00045 [Lysobacter sp.]|nr:hypothetical protein [Lysobacter sp.]
MNNRPLMTSALAAALLPALAFAAHAGVPGRLVPSGSASLQNLPSGSDALQDPEFDSALSGGEDGGSYGTSTQINRTIAPTTGHGASVNAGKKAKSNPGLGVHFDGLNFRNQRLANGGKQFSVEPPDQALAVGNGYVLEAVNDVVRVFDTAGVPQTAVVDLNTFYGYAAAIDRSTGARGPTITDPVAYFDADTQRWFLVVLTLDHVGTTSALSGTNHLDIAVSSGASPLGSWTVYRLPVQNDGSDSTPNHHCPGGPCLGDYPHIGADANGIYLTTNEFPLFADGFTGAQVIALSKASLVSGGPATYVQFNTADPAYLRDLGTDGLAPGFTVWPATSPAGNYATTRNGTEYLLSSDAVFTSSGSDNRIRVWALTGTASLDGDGSGVQLQVLTVPVHTYGVPARATQKAGDYPLGQCLGDATCRAFITSGTPVSRPEGGLDVNDSRMQQVVYANGKLWGALDTDAIVDGTHRASVAWYIIQPQMGDTSFRAKTLLDGILGLADTNLGYPAVAVTPSGRGVIGFTLVGPNDYPSAGYAGIDAILGAGAVHTAAAGAGPQDGFTEYRDFSRRPRWGDYGAAVADGGDIWIASEYINQTCTLATYMTAPFGSCGGTRTSLGNWATHISKVTP